MEDSRGVFVTSSTDLRYLIPKTRANPPSQYSREWQRKANLLRLIFIRWEGSMFYSWIRRALIITFIVLVSCGRPTVLAESTPRPTGGPALTDVAPPPDPLKIPISKASWMPVSIGAGLGKDLVRALNDQESVALILPTSAPARYAIAIPSPVAMSGLLV